MESKYSIIEYLSDNHSSCGYCKSKNSNHSNGMWAHTMNVEDYQVLIDRGWRRSGLYCYKPVQTSTCCPLYTIRCEALNLQLTKSQKKILKKVRKFLNDGITPKTKHSEDVDSDSGGEMESANDFFDKSISKVIEEKSNEKIEELMEVDASAKKEPEQIHVEESTAPNNEENNRKIEESSLKESQENHENLEKLKNNLEKSCIKIPKPGVGRDMSKPQCKKAKLLRLEKKQKKMIEKGLVFDDSPKKAQNLEKSLEDFIEENASKSAVHKLEMRLLPSNSKETLIKESWNLFRKYQMVIHNEQEDECSYRTFNSFLVETPLKPQQRLKGNSSVHPGYGSFHQQYRLDGKLIAVGVIDILPKCISSVYFFYDPDYSFLSLGTYGSLRELELARSLYKESPELCYYYMGYYVHTCPKMRYKARYSPSSLLCPEVYTWHPIVECQRKLDTAKYSRFNDDIDAICEDNFVVLNEVLILHNQIAMSFSIFKMRAVVTQQYEEEIKEYAELVGRKCAERMLLYR